MAASVHTAEKFNVKLCILLPLVVAVTMILWLVPVDFYGIDGLTVVEKRTIAIFVFTALMWMFEIIPNWTTSLIVIVVMLLTVSDKGIRAFCDLQYGTLIDYKSIMASFADPVVMLFLGGFVLAIVASKYGMDAKLAKVLLGLFGKNPRFVLLGFLLVISLFSMFMSNTATAAMMLAFLAPVLKALPDNETGKVALALSIPIAANLGGMGTPIGTPPNAIALGALESAGYQISFVSWMEHMVPYVIVMILIAWGLLMLFFPFKAKKIELHIETRNDKKTWRTYVAWGTFAVTLLLWVTEAITGINSNIVALIPLAVYTCTGVFGKDDIIVILIAGAVCYALSNFISNSATAALLVPILVVVGSAMADPAAANHDQFMQFGGMEALIPFIAVCASLAMILPISTPPNAIASSTGLVRTKDMAKVGIIIGVVGFIIGYFMLTEFFPFDKVA